jgi:hypothetical protein
VAAIRCCQQYVIGVPTKQIIFLFLFFVFRSFYKTSAIETVQRILLLFPLLSVEKKEQFIVVLNETILLLRLRRQCVINTSSESPLSEYSLLFIILINFWWARIRFSEYTCCK